MTTDDDDIDHQAKMIHWLENKSPEVRHYVARYLNWDNSEAVLRWIVERADCELATARCVFWGSDPVTTLERWPELPVRAAGELALYVSQRAVRGEYPDSGLANWFDDDFSTKRSPRLVTAEARPTAPFQVPDVFLQASGSRPPTVPQALRVEVNAELQALLWNLGSAVKPLSTEASQPMATSVKDDRERNLKLAAIWLGIAFLLFVFAIYFQVSHWMRAK